MSKHYDNLDVLAEFLEANDIDKNNHVTFRSIVTISTPVHNRRTEHCETMITFDGFNDEGRVTMLQTELDPLEFPTVFKAKYNDFVLSGKSLLISDTHPTIGKYEAIITPV